MDKQQFATLAIGIKSAYPASKILEDNASMDFWYMTLKDMRLLKMLLWSIFAPIFIHPT